MRKHLLAFAALLVAASASAQPLPTPGGPGSNGSVTVLYTYGSNAGVGSGADTTEDTLLTFNIPAGTLRSVGDRIKIFASGSGAATTDTRVARLRLNNTGAVVSATAALVGTTSWILYMEVQKIGPSVQQIFSSSIQNGGGTGTASAAGALTDTSQIVLTVTGQNTTTASANSIIVKYVSVEYLP